MKHAFDLGVRDKDLGEVCEILSKYFNSSLEERYSEYLGGYYYRISSADVKLHIQLNRDCDDIAEEEYPDVNVLVIIHASKNTEEIQNFISATFDSVIIRSR